MENASVDIHEVGDIFVAIVEVVGERGGGGKENQRACGDGLGGIPDVGLIEGVVGAAELLNTEEVFVEKTLLKVGRRRNRAHGDAAAKAVEGHRDHGVAGFPADGAILGIVDDRPNARLGFDEGLVAVGVVLGHEVVDFGVLVEIVGDVGLALGGRAVSDVVVIVGDIVCGDELIADVVAVLLVVLRGSAAKEVVGVDVCGIGGVGDGGEEVAVGFVRPRDHGLIRIGQLRLEVRSWQIRPLKTIGFRNTPRSGIINNGLFPLVVHAVAHVPAEGVPMAGEGLGIP